MKTLDLAWFKIAFKLGHQVVVFLPVKAQSGRHSAGKGVKRSSKTATKL